MKNKNPYLKVEWLSNGAVSIDIEATNIQICSMFYALFLYNPQILQSALLSIKAYENRNSNEIDPTLN